MLLQGCVRRNCQFERKARLLRSCRARNRVLELMLSMKEDGAESEMDVEFASSLFAYQWL